jgi:hypothetical protein
MERVEIDCRISTSSIVGRDASIAELEGRKAFARRGDHE